MATLTKRAPYQFQATIRRKGYPTQSHTFETKRDGEAWARATEAVMDSGRFVSTKEADTATLHEALARYDHEVGSRKGSHKSESRRIKAWPAPPAC